ncbi:guanine nucleotide-binding protein-like 1 isoform X1 [Dendroctonus ponderosae]|uniref:Guanine nucleotide-binding protein-like 1 n=1 Tax=Dendroctonus ponderosae TaxID=77166 RepID=U4U784_DENPD|nr:guanine nucleotide-binding protein-like 1 isoform X1 [Dendroctonus ponderosae]XP_048525326.1 guanine nucleotide-binding protein-like 1 isoform X1 [Dendroctonus ponderosae]ERL88208.1 hypothetical protein D910_05596 [Dendroctonus ponderosae]KAH1010091.1 hypothetical protein HUJ05_004446 [Dendroctonus ponderosae]
MPQGRRKTPFSGKAKKEQLKNKRERKSHQPFVGQRPAGATEDEAAAPSIQKINYQPTKVRGSRPNRYALQFFVESKEEIRQKKEQARNTLLPVEDDDLEVSGEEFYPDNLGFPKRPHWEQSWSKEKLEQQENRYFQEYLKGIETSHDVRELGYFELNLETWRQLWRVLEMSDIILFVVDIRFSATMFPPSLYHHVTEELGKDFILVLNKIDLAPAPLVVAWKHYFETKYPLLKICMFTSAPGYNLVGHTENKGGLQVRRRRGAAHMAAEGTQMLFNLCQDLVKNELDISSWQQKIQEEMQDDQRHPGKVHVDRTVEVKNETGFYQYQRFNGEMLTIGCIGQPNVGKSSLINAIMGKKVVSVSRTPGHTKHFQTIHITKEVRLCDCPGLVFPSKVPKPLQVLMGSFPIAQLREPFTTIQFLAERLDLIKLLKLQHPEGDETWSAMDICDAWAKRKGFITAKAARLDSFRAVNNLLQMAVAGKICLCLRPPNYTENQKFWQSHPDVGTVKWIQARELDEAAPVPDFELSSDEHSQNDDSGSEDDDSENSADLGAICQNKFALLEA